MSGEHHLVSVEEPKDDVTAPGSVFEDYVGQ